MKDKYFNQKTVKDLNKLFKIFFRGCDINIDIKCLNFYNAYDPKTDEVVTYNYKFHIIIGDNLYVYDGWCYEDNLKDISMGIFSHWLLSNYEIYDEPRTAWYRMYIGRGNLVLKER